MLTWLQQQGLAEDAARAWLRAAGGRPEDALALSRSGRDVAAWARLPKAVAAGMWRPWPIWPPPVVEPAEAVPRPDERGRRAAALFPAAGPAQAPSQMVLARWAKSLAQEARTAEHPFNAGLMLEALVAQARSVLQARH
jgi:DNA polymerase-3 subunit delta'